MEDHEDFQSKADSSVINETHRAAYNSKMNSQLLKFDEDKEKWIAHLIKVNAYFEGNELTNDAKKRVLLVAGLETKAVRILCGRVYLRKLNALTFYEVVAALDTY